MTVEEKIKEIASLDRTQINPDQKMYALLSISQAFAVVLKNALVQDPDNQALQNVASEELNTTNVASEELGVTEPMDHCEYLQHFITKEGISKRISDTLKMNAEEYLHQVSHLKENTAIIANAEKRFEPIIDKILSDNDFKNTKRFMHFREAHKDLDA